MADSPAIVSFLNAEEAKEVSLRLSHDNDDLASHYHVKFAKAAFANWKIWLLTVPPYVLGCIFTVLGGFYSDRLNKRAVYPMIPIMVMWNGNNIGGSTKRGAGIAIQIAFGNCGGVISSFIYKNTDAPRYFTGHGVCLGFLSMSFILIAFQWFILGRINMSRDAEHPHPS
ncbi:hypothetical protein ACEPPN_015155 [Leptodophora sp. 'Broadleaf-Isolate-01']